MKTIAIHQPEYLPWLGLLDKARRADVFVLLDDVQFNRASFQHRARILGPGGAPAWLTIPFVHRHPQLIREVQAADASWTWRHTQVIEQSYRRAPAFASVWRALRGFYETPCLPVVEAACATTQIFLDALGVSPETVLSSELAAQGHKGELVLDICRRLGATHYLSGKSGAEYLDREAFAAAGVEIVVQQFVVPAYRDGLPEGVTLSALDAWMHLGDQVKELLK